ncbi:hypothetical protein HNR42_001341 [Deinobacterium chartae]|uniref:DUF4260 family protein n=1 Tax=Deinobacterium chartae TaxID=521158 RepID=A0A841I0X2_9DEIO|nr:DUF4260 family protein [Deinobacterium chartae]MBB6097918.1 hypothetical protein [Deinobacterium chartae]
MPPSARLPVRPQPTPLRLLRLEGLALLAASTLLFLHLGGAWGLLLLGFLADLSFVAYLAGPRVGAATYNLLHSTPLPLAAAVLGYVFQADAALFGGLILLAHIGLDRACGYGLKYPDAFGHTHLS